jgi:hypothetical protein
VQLGQRAPQARLVRKDKVPKGRPVLLALSDPLVQQELLVRKDKVLKEHKDRLVLLGPQAQQVQRELQELKDRVLKVVLVLQELPVLKDLLVQLVEAVEAVPVHSRCQLRLQEWLALLKRVKRASPVSDRSWSIHRSSRVVDGLLLGRPFWKQLQACMPSFASTTSALVLVFQGLLLTS